MSPSAIRVDPADNVASLLRAHAAGERPRLAEGEGPTLTADIPLGHKVALASIPAGSDVIKYGAPIGRARIPISAGDHVHLHNLEGQIG